MGSTNRQQAREKLAQARALEARRRRRLYAETCRNLGRMYVDDARFRVNYEKITEGLAAYLRDHLIATAVRLIEQRGGASVGIPGAGRLQDTELVSVWRTA